jgi:hypothetical protein
MVLLGVLGKQDVGRMGRNPGTVLNINIGKYMDLGRWRGRTQGTQCQQVLPTSRQKLMQLKVCVYCSQQVKLIRAKKKQEKITQYFPKFNGTRKTASKVGWDCCKIRKKQDTKNIQKHVLQV